MAASETDKKAQKKIRTMRNRMECARGGMRGQEHNAVVRTIYYLHGFLRPQTKHQKRWKWLAERV